MQGREQSERLRPQQSSPSWCCFVARPQPGGDPHGAGLPGPGAAAGLGTPPDSAASQLPALPAGSRARAEPASFLTPSHLLLPSRLCLACQESRGATCWRLGAASAPPSPRLTLVLTLLHPAAGQSSRWGAKRAGSWPPCLAVLAAPSPASAVYQGLGEAPALVPRGGWRVLGLLLLHSVPGPRCLHTLVRTLPASQQPGPALPGKATSSPPLSSSSPHPECSPGACARSCCLLAAFGQQGCWRCVPGQGSASAGCPANCSQGPRCPPAAPVSSGHHASSSCGMAAEESSSPLGVVWQHQAAWGSLPRDKDHPWCAPHGAGCSQHPSSRWWHKQPHARTRGGMLLRAGTCMAARDVGLCRGAVGCRSVTSLLKHSCPPPVPRVVHSLLHGAQPGKDPAGTGTMLDFICEEVFFMLKKSLYRLVGLGEG